MLLLYYDSHSLQYFQFYELLIQDIQIYPLTIQSYNPFISISTFAKFTFHALYFGHTLVKVFRF